MAITGIILLGFVLAHMIGNLKVYIGFLAEEGAYEIDIYGEALRSLFFPILPEYVALWLLRIGLIAAFVLHLHSAYALTVMNRRARQVDYQGPRTYLAANYASRDFTWGVAPFAPDGWEYGAIYSNFIASFSRVPVAILYIVANLALGVHIFHGAWSMFQSLGINNPKFNAWRRYLAIAFAAVIVIANVSFPIAVLAGLVS
jgi:succinate dehydrogenase / fumarate reductase cytochrome b subunit